MKQTISGFHRDDLGDWVAELTCNHFQHVRHNPPWTNREWVTTQAGRQSMLGEMLDCIKCDSAAPQDSAANHK